MTPKTVEEQVCKYLNELHEKRGSPNDIEWVDCHKIIDHQDVIWFVEGSWSTCHVAETVFPLKRLLRYLWCGSRIICFTVQSKGRTLETSASLYIHAGNLTLSIHFIPNCHVSVTSRFVPMDLSYADSDVSYPLLTSSYPNLWTISIQQIMTQNV